MRTFVLGLLAASSIGYGQAPHARWAALRLQANGVEHEFASYAIHASLLANGDVVAFQAGSSPFPGLASTPGAYVIRGLNDASPFLISETSVALPTYSGQTNPMSPPRNHRNLFCSAHHILPDFNGTTLFAGGDDNDQNPADLGQERTTWSGANTLMLFRPGSGADPYASPWSQPHTNPSLDPALTWLRDPLGFETLQRGRWYPGMTPIGSGRFLVSSGTGERGPNVESAHERSFEVLTMRTRNGAWIPSFFNSLVPYVGAAGDNSAAGQTSKFYPFLFPMKNTPGTINPMPGEIDRRDHHWLFVSANGRVLRLPLATLVHQGRWGEHNADHLDHSSSLSGNSFSFDYPSAAWYDGQALITGGSPGTSTEASTPHWILVDTTGNTRAEMTRSTDVTRMRVGRKNHAMVTLPNGTIMAVGGNINGSTGYLGGGAPPLSPAAGDRPHVPTGTYFSHSRVEFFDLNTRTWTMPAGVEHIMPLPLRAYHTTALLLPCGRVLVGGGDPVSDDGLPDAAQRRKFLYTPTYIPQDESKRPSLSLDMGPDRAVFYGESVAAQVVIDMEGSEDTFAVQRLTAISLGSMTHAFDMGQRAYSVTLGPGGFQPHEGNMSESLSGVPITVFKGIVQGSVTFEDPWYMPPGWYMLFAQDSKGRMSKAEMFRIVERYSIDLPVGASRFDGGSWSADLGNQPIVHGDMVYPSIGADNQNWGGVRLANPLTSDTSKVVTLNSSGSTSARMRVRNFVPSQVNFTQNRLLQIKMEAQTSVDGVTPQFFVRTSAGDTWASASIHSSTAAGDLRQFSRRERYRVFVIDPATVPWRDSSGFIEVEIRFPAAATAHVDMVQVGGYLQSVPY